MVLLALFACGGSSSQDSKDTGAVDTGATDTDTDSGGESLPQDSDAIPEETGDPEDTSTIDENTGRIEIVNETDVAFYVIWACDRDTDECRSANGNGSPLIGSGGTWAADIAPASYQFTVQDDGTGCASKPYAVDLGEISVWTVYELTGTWSDSEHSCKG